VCGLLLLYSNSIPLLLLGMQVVKLGGPVYRIGVGGGSASSVEVRDHNISDCFGDLNIFH
jgi:phosphoribosylformylglycinamidine (FGAM) synthase-like enzyme